MRKFLIAGNWKMHGSRATVKNLIEAIQQDSFAYPNVDVLVIPTLVHLQEVQNLLAGTPYIALGAQNLYPGTEGAFTGEVSGMMLKDIGCQYVLIGHSERRTKLREDETLIAEKFKAAIDAQLIPILCIGETAEERKNNQTEAVIEKQLKSVLAVAGMEAFRTAVIAYEPVWAIGTGLTATPEQAQTVHAFIRKLIAQNNVDIGNTIRILYGGSMKADNAPALLTMPDIDGGLIGGASLNAASFLQICLAANETGTATKNDKVCKIG